MELNKIYNEDCLGNKELGTGMYRIPDKTVDCIITDLPYGTTKCKWDEIIPFDHIWKHYERIIKDNGAIILTATQPFTSILINSNLKLFKYTWVWEKTMAVGSMFAKKRPMKAHEDICVFYKRQPIYNPQMTDGEAYTRKEGSLTKDSIIGMREKGYETKSDGKRYPRSVIKIANPNRHNIHPTQKPLKLIEYLLLTYTNEEMTVLDSCMGSGTTAVACINTNRNYIGFELDQEYHRLGEERVHNLA